MQSTITVLLGSTTLLVVPIMLAALGEVIIERSGILNIGIEGVMLFGCLVTAAMLQLGSGLTAAAIAAVPCGLLIGAFLGWLYVQRRVNQIVGGVLFNLLALGLTTVIYVGNFRADTSAKIFGAHAVPLLSQLPVLGKSMFTQPIFVYVAFAFVPLVHYFLYHTWLGLHIRAVGERPDAVDSAGVSVRQVRNLAMVLGCGLIALGGAALVVLQSGAFTSGMTAGNGYIALAIAMVARWKPVGTVVAAALFALAESFQFQAQTLDISSIAPQVWAALPYAVTIVAILVGGVARFPSALAVPFVRPDEQT